MGLIAPIGGSFAPTRPVSNTGRVHQKVDGHFLSAPRNLESIRGKATPFHHRGWPQAMCVSNELLIARGTPPNLEIDPETRFWATFVVGSPLFPNRHF